MSEIQQSQFVDRDGESLLALTFELRRNGLVVLVSRFGRAVLPEIDHTAIESSVGLSTWLVEQIRWHLLSGHCSSPCSKARIEGLLLHFRRATGSHNLWVSYDLGNCPLKDSNLEPTD